MKKLILLLLIFQFDLVYSQSISNITLLGTKNEYSSGGVPTGWHYASCHGYVANGREYAIIGHYAGTTVYDITNTPTIINKGTFAGPGSFYNYREMKTYSHYLYIVSEGGQGVQIVDLQYLPDSIHFVRTFTFPGYTRSHTISQDGRYLYSNGGTYNNGGVFILDLLDPENPVKRGQWGTSYIHDSFIKNDTIYGASIYDGYVVILDARNKDSIKFIRQFTYPGAVTHNVWTSDDRRILVTSDEGGSNHAKLWDISDIQNQIQLADLMPYDNASMVHNAYIKDNLLYLAHYRAGVIVYNISNPSSPVELGHYDTHPGINNTQYQGCWNVYPYLPSGKIIASDISTGLYILRLNSASINIKLLMEGMYDPIFNRLERRDSVKVYLHQSVSPYNKIDSIVASIDSLSYSGLFQFYNTPAGTYYIVAKHFNCIETWSKEGGEFLTNDGTLYNYDFTTSASQAYGNNLKLKVTKYTLYSGDVNQDGVVDGADLSDIDNDAFIFLTGLRLPTDLDGNNMVDGSDFLIGDNNSFSFVSLIRP